MVLKLLGIMLLGYYFLGAQESSNKVFEPPMYLNDYSAMIDNPYRFNTTPLKYTSNLFQSMICIYQRYLRSYENSTICQFTPSCSRYSYIAIEGLGTIKGLVLTFDRLWRCNIGARGKYSVFYGFLFDPPIQVTKTEQIENSKPETKLSYIDWLIKNNEWNIAYEKVLEKEYSDSHTNNRKLLAKFALNFGNPKSAISWLDNGNDTDSKLLRSICYYRMGYYNRSREEIENYITITETPSPVAGALWLHNSLHEQNESIDVYLPTMISTLKNRTDLDLINMQFTRYNQKKNQAPTQSLIFSMIIPGSGQAMNGFIEDGIYAFVFSAGFGILTWQNLNSKNYGISMACGIGFIMSYSANLFAAYHSSSRSASQIANDLHKKLNSIFDPYEVQRP